MEATTYFVATAEQWALAREMRTALDKAHDSHKAYDDQRAFLLRGGEPSRYYARDVVQKMPSPEMCACDVAAIYDRARAAGIPHGVLGDMMKRLTDTDIMSRA